MKPKISIIVPCYKVEKYLDRCIRSLENQTLREIEIILVDDASPDNCPAMCDNYAKKDRRIKVIHKENGGLGFARNSGIEIATGEYIAFVDSDDFVDLEMYKSLYAMAVDNNCDAVFCGYRTEVKAGRWIDSQEFDEDLILEGENKKSFMLCMIASPIEEKTDRKYAMSVWRAIYKRDIIERFNIRFLSEREVMSEDLPFNVSFLTKSNRIGIINKNFYYYCYNGCSLSKTFKKEKFYAGVNLFKIVSDEVKNITDAQLRCDRFIIGYTRTHFQLLVNSKEHSKLSYIKEICNNSIWEEISNRYHTHYARDPFQRYFYQLLVAKQYRILLIYCRLATLLKQHILGR